MLSKCSQRRTSFILGRVNAEKFFPLAESIRNESYLKLSQCVPNFIIDSVNKEIKN
jgi:hypothetical protein